MRSVFDDGPIEVVREDLRRLPMPSLLRKYESTPEEYEAIADEDLRCEFLDGVLIVHSPASIAHERRVAFLLTLLNIHVSRKDLGEVYGSHGVMEFRKDRCFCADVCFLAREHLDRIQRGRIQGPADLAVEVISASTRAYDFGEKRDAYHAGRIPEIWFVDDEREQWIVEMLRGKTYHRRVLKRGRFASTVLPGLTIDVSWLWREPLPSALECLGLQAIAASPLTQQAPRRTTNGSVRKRRRRLTGGNRPGRSGRM